MLLTQKDMDNMSQEEIKRLLNQLGDSSITMTMDLYTHLLPEVNDKCVNLLNNIISSAVESKGVIEKYGT